MPSPRIGGVPRTRARTTPTGFLPEIQALRALAVTIVVLYHLWPAYLPGGYVGVDVFFAISGYLITQHLIRQLMRHGSIHLRQFYARRIRRLLPASLLVLLVVGLATIAFAPVILWPDAGKNIVASAFYLENWSLLVNAVDYLGAGTGTIPTQHFWSLSVEEQFYLFWPLLLVASASIALRIPRLRPKAVLGGAMAAIAVVSLGYSVVATSFDQSSAYFNTGTRMWEFALGGLSALLVSRITLPRVGRVLVSWTGLVVIIGTALVFTDSTAFPGWLATVPVVATIAVIVAGAPQGALSPSPLFRFRPVQFLGDISYSVYLWHWPLIVFIPLIIGRPLTVPAKIAILISSVVLAWLSKRFVEDPLRSGPTRTGRIVSTVQIVRSAPRPIRVRAVFAVALAGMILVAGVGGTAWAVSESRIGVADAALARLPAPQTIPCFGAAALAPDAVCASAGPFSQRVYPDPIIAKYDTGSTGCQQNSIATEIVRCSFGSTRGGALRVALAGDSHAGQWLAAVKVAAEVNGWHLDTFLRSGCGISTVSSPSPGAATRCVAWNASVLSALSSGSYDVVIVSERSSLVGGGRKSPVAVAEESKGIATSWGRITASGARVIALRDTPQPVSAGIPDEPTCVEATSASECSFPRARGLVPDPQISAVERTPGAKLVDLTDYFCGQSTCAPVVGGVLVYSDGHHMTGVYSATLGPYLGRALSASLSVQPR